ncbi:MAG: hypothetical protein RLY86_1978 [Pseudomonadota bacterium]|jgi:hypothetical protein
MTRIPQPGLPVAAPTAQAGIAPARTALSTAAAMLVAIAAAPAPAPALACPVPALTGTPPGAGPGDDGRDAMDRSREQLEQYETCLRDKAEILELLDPEAARRLDLQRDAAAQLKRTIDAWIKARTLAESRTGPS